MSHRHHHGRGQKISIMKRPADANQGPPAYSPGNPDEQPHSEGFPASPAVDDPELVRLRQQRQKEEEDGAVTPTTFGGAAAAAASSAGPPAKGEIKVNEHLDADCDLCQQKCHNYKDLAEHQEKEHLALHYWGNLLEMMPRPAAPAPENAEQIGSMAIAIAQKKDAGPVAWEAMHRIWRQIRLVVAHRELELRVFGSCIAMGSWDGKGDIDLCFVRRPPPRRPGATEDESPLISVSDEVKEVMRVSRLLRDAGFAFDDLEPVVRTRVPIVKHHHRAPDLPDRWALIDNTPVAKHVRLVFQKKSDLLDDIFRGEPHCEWNKNHTSLVVHARSTSEACQVFKNPWTFVGACHQRALARCRAEREKEERELQQQQYAQLQQQKQNDGDDDDGAAAAMTLSRAQQEEQRRQMALKYPVESFTRGAFEKLLVKREWASNAYYEFPEMFHSDFDLSFRSPGFRNSVLLRAYFLQSPLARVGAAFVKQWSKDSAVNLAIKGYWTTYCTNIVWIAFLLHKGVVKFVDPQSIPSYMNDDDFEHDLIGEHTPMLPAEEQRDPVGFARRMGQLVFEFYRYYAFDFDWDANVVTLRQPTPFKRDGVTTAARPWTHDNEVRNGKFRDRRWYRLCIDDPYEADLSLGRHLSPQKAKRVISQFRYIALRLATQKKIGDHHHHHHHHAQGAAAGGGEGLSIPKPLHSKKGGAKWADAPTEADTRQKFAFLVESDSDDDDDDEQQNDNAAVSSDGLPAAVPTTGPLFLNVKPDDWDPAALRRDLSWMLVGHQSTTLSEFLSFLPPLDLYKLACCNTFFPLQEIFAKCGVEVAATPTLQEVERGVVPRPRIAHVDADATFVPRAAQMPLRRLKRYLERHGEFEVTMDCARVIGLQGQYRTVLRTLFEHTDTALASQNAILLFRGKSDRDAYIAANQSKPGAAAAAAAAAAGEVVEQRDPTHSMVGKCDECGARQRRVYGSTDKKNKARYCEACWNAYDKSF